MLFFLHSRRHKHTHTQAVTPEETSILPTCVMARCTPPADDKGDYGSNNHTRADDTNY